MCFYSYERYFLLWYGNVLINFWWLQIGKAPREQNVNSVLEIWQQILSIHLQWIASNMSKVRLISVWYFHRNALLADLVRCLLKFLRANNSRHFAKSSFDGRGSPGQILINDEERDAFCIATSNAHVLLIALRWPYSITSQKKRNYAKACIVARISTLTPLCLGTKQVPPVHLLRVFFAESRMSCGLNDIFISRQGKKACTSNTRKK